MKEVERGLKDGWSFEEAEAWLERGGDLADVVRELAEFALKDAAAVARKSRADWVDVALDALVALVTHGNLVVQAQVAALHAAFHRMVGGVACPAGAFTGLRRTVAHMGYVRTGKVRAKLGRRIGHMAPIIAAWNS